MSTPTLTRPVLLTRSDLQSNPALTTQLTALANAAFQRSHMREPEKWTLPVTRFTPERTLLNEMPSEGVMAVLLDESSASSDSSEAAADGSDIVEIAIVPEDGSEVVKCGRLVACAGAVPWKGGWQQQGVQGEAGWEIKWVCVQPDPEYSGKGLAVRLLKFLEEFVVGKERAALLQRGELKTGDLGKVDLWVYCVESLNGAYWRRRGFEEVRRRVYERIWGCKTSFEMLVLRRGVEFGV